MTNPTHVPGAVRWRTPTGADDRFTFAVPADWCRVRLVDPAQRDRDVRQAAQRLASRHPDRHRLASRLARLLQAGLDEAPGATAATEVHLAVGPAAGPPLGCALTVTVLPASGVAACTALARSAGRSAAVEQVAGPHGPGLDVVSLVAPDPGGGRPHASALVQHLRSGPDGTAVLLSGSVPQPGALEPLRAVFDAVARTLRWLA